ncbi:hypothetical protein SRIMM317S_03134 [Streptomyces rimosus subsp. rimosus]
MAFEEVGVGEVQVLRGGPGEQRGQVYAVVGASLLLGEDHHAPPPTVPGSVRAVGSAGAFRTVRPGERVPYGQLLQQPLADHAVADENESGPVGG